jgi:hypothetical protein
MDGSSLRLDLWRVLKECVRFDEMQPVHGPHMTASQIVGSLSTLIAQQPDGLEANLRKRTWSSTAERQVVLPDLSAEVRRIGDLPITGGGFCDIWMGERLGTQKVALKVLKMFGVPDQIRRVRIPSAAEFINFTSTDFAFLAFSCGSRDMVPTQTPEHP